MKNLLTTAFLPLTIGVTASRAAQDVGAVYLYDGATLALISTLTGTTAHDWRDY